MKAIKHILFLNCILFCALVSSAQTAVANHQKYWYQRSKMRNDFMKVGPNQGESLPLVERGFHSQLQSAPSNISYNSWMSGADLISEMGKYIAVLATEYKILIDNNQRTDSVLKELYYALYALDRLDYNAESYYSNSTKQLDGFMMRDDVPKDFLINNYRHFHYYNDWLGTSDVITKGDIDGNLFINQIPNDANDNDRGFLSIVPKQQWEIASVYRDYQFKGNNDNKLAMSQDHAISLLYGISFVNRFLGSSENYQGKSFIDFGSTNVNLLDEARAIALRVVKRFHDDNWFLKDPDGNHVGGTGGSGDNRAYAYAMVETLARIENQSPINVNQFFNISSPVPFSPGPGLHDSWTLGAGFVTWNGLAKSLGTTFDITVQYAELSAACNCLYDSQGGYFNTIIKYITSKIWKWLGAVFGWIVDTVELISNLFVPLIWNENTALDMLPNALQENPGATIDKFWIQFPQYHAIFGREILHDPFYSSFPNPYFRVKQAIDNGNCQGPYDFSSFSTSTPYYGAYEWSGTDLIEHPNTLGIAKDSHQHLTGEYSGLDYMLYHNLYYIYAGTSGIVDLSSRYVHVNYPNAGIGSNVSPFVLGSFEYITADNTLASNAGIDYRAGKQVHLLPGFSAQAGADFHAYINPYNCGPDYRSQSMRTTNSTNSGDSTDTYGGMGSTAVTHHYYTPQKEKDKSPSTENLILNPTVKNNNSNTLKKIIDLNHKMNVYPNPNTGKFTIEMNVSNNTDTYILTIYNSLGDLCKIVENINAINNLVTVENNQFTPGTYFVRLVSSSGEQYSEKVVVN
jgi:hypothetical protein